MAHTYLFQPGTWQATGHHVGADGRTAALTGLSRIIHAPDAWDVSGHMTIELDQPVTLEHHYTFRPMAPNQHDDAWSSVNPSLGRLEGYLAVVDDSLLLSWRTLGGDSFGMEYLRQVDADRYIDRGSMFAGGMRVSSWSATLVRQ